MERQIDWQAKQEEEIESLYRLAADHFSVDQEFSQFLLSLADQEHDHSIFLRQLKDPLYSLETESALEKELQQFSDIKDFINSKRRALQSGDLDADAMLETVVHLEFSEWNALFLLAMNWRGQSDGEFRRMLREIEKHRQTVENYLLQSLATEDLYQKIHTLAPLWRRRILILDDDPAIARLLGIIMAPFGELKVATHPLEALRSLQEDHFDVVISDVCMPDMDGIEFYQHAIALDPEIGRHFIFFTATNHIEHLRFISEHQIPILKKPTPLNVLQQTMTDLLH